MRKLLRKRVFFERICARDIRLLHASLLRFNQKACWNIRILRFSSIIEKYEIHTIFSVYVINQWKCRFSYFTKDCSHNGLKITTKKKFTIRIIKTNNCRLQSKLLPAFLYIQVELGFYIPNIISK